MKSTKIDKLGRVVITVSYRKELNIDTDTEVKITLSDGQIVIKPFHSSCLLCGRAIENNIEVALCTDCIEKVKSLS